MVDVRGFNGGLNTDSSPELLPNGDYYYAMNIENTAEGIVNLPGNLVVGNSIAVDEGFEWICGSHFDKKRQRIYYFINNSLGYHKIISHDLATSQSTVLFKDTAFNTDEFSGNVSMTFQAFPGLISVTVGTTLAISSGATFTISGTTLNNDGTYVAISAHQIAGGTQVYFIPQSTITAGTSTGTFTYIESFDFSEVLRWKNVTKYDPNYCIKDIKVIHRESGGDLIYFISPSKKLCKFNYDTLLNNFNDNPAILDYFNVIKAPPSNLINCDVVDLLTVYKNNIRKKLFQFKYRYVYLDDEKSVWGAVSKIPIPFKTTDDAYGRENNRQNAIRLSFSTGNFTVKKIEIAGRVNIDNGWSDFFLIDTIDKERANIGDDINYVYDFKNDSIYQSIDIQESNLLFDYVPEEANALELANGNTIVVGGLKDGYDRDLNIDSSVEVTYSKNSALVTSTLGYTLNNSTDSAPWVDNHPGWTFNNGFGKYDEITFAWLRFTGDVSAGDEIIIKVNMAAQRKSFDDLIWEESSGEFKVVAREGWTKSDIYQALNDYDPVPLRAYNLPGGWRGTQPTRPFKILGGDTIVFGSYRIPGRDRDWKRWIVRSIQVIIKRASNFSGDDVYSTYRFYGSYKFGLVYYDKNGKTNGVYTSPDLSANIGGYEVRGTWGLISPEPNIVNMTIRHAPPSWASYYHVVRTKDLSNDFSLYAISPNFIRESAYMFIDISSIPATAQKAPEFSTVINYGATSFVKGDRVKILRQFGDNPKVAFNIDMEILAVVERPDTRKYLKIRNISVSEAPGLNPGQYIIDIYRPAKVLSDKELVYYEIGEKYDVVVDINGNRLHQGNSANQSVFNPAVITLPDGDCYLKARVMISSTDDATFGTAYVVDRNFSERYSSSVWSQGRPLIVDEDIKQEYYPAMLRFSQSYIYGTNINNTNRFYPNNFEEADASFGDILRLKTRENFIRMFQRHKVGMIPIYRQIIIDNAQSSQVALSERLLNKPNYYSGEYGIDKYGSSLVSTDYGDYFVDTLNKAIVRVSLDGITNISDTNNLMTWSNDNIFEDSYGYGCFNYENRNVIMLIGRREDNQGIITLTNKIVAYNEPKKKFESFYSYTDAEAILFINGLIYTLIGQNRFGLNIGKNIYIHNNPVRNDFFGEGSVSSAISTTFNSNLQLKKTYTAIEELSTDVWTGVLKTGPLTNQETTITLQDFTKYYGTSPFLFTLSRSLENKFNATIKRQSNNGKNKFYGPTMKGLYAQLEITNNSADEQKLISVSLKYIQSPLTNT